MHKARIMFLIPDVSFASSIHFGSISQRAIYAVTIALTRIYYAILTYVIFIYETMYH